jgi:hypothetical protein
MLAIHSKILISFYFLSSFFCFYLVSLFSPLTSHLLSLPLLSPQRLHWKFESKERPRKPKANKTKEKKKI